MNAELKAKLEKVTNLPSPPAVAAQVIDLAQQPEVHLADVAQAINCDASLAAKVMRVANSAMYARRRSSTNLRQALIVLGLNATVTLALGFSLMPILRRGPSEQKMLEHCWRRSLMAAICARSIADVSRKMNSEEAFLSALLQDVGILGLDRLFPDLYGDAADFFDNHEALIEFEKSQLGSDHAEVGVWLLHQWNLPEYLQDAVAVSHQLHTQGTGNRVQNLSQCVALSGPLADLWLCGATNVAQVSQLARLAKRELSLSADDFARVMANIGDTLPELTHIFETELIDSDEARAITESAQEILTARSLQSLQEADEAVEKAQRLQTYASDLEQENQRDTLTQVASRGYLTQLLQRGYDHATRFAWPLAVMFVDLDHFKQVNDTYGHAAGDTVLRNVGKILSDAVRCSDTVGRYGGEEFLIILPGADRDGIEIVANRVLNALRNEMHAIGSEHVIAVTASIGCATVGEGRKFDSMESFIAGADQALYAAKGSGRDRFVIYDVQAAAEPISQSISA